MIRPFFWTFVNTGGSQIISFVAVMLIARIGTPEDFGLIAIASAIILLMNVLSEAGLVSTIILDDEFREDKASTILWLSTCLAVMGYIFISFSADIIGQFFNMPELGILLPIMAISCIATSLGNVHAALITRRLKFDRKALLSLSASFISAVIGVGVAFEASPLSGLVTIFVLTPVLLSLFMWVFVPWRVQFLCKPNLIIGDLPFAANISLTNLIDQGFKSSIPLLIGQRYDAVTLGYFNRAEAVKNIAGQSIEKIINKVSFPLLSQSRRADEEQSWSHHIIISQGLLFFLLPLVWLFYKYSSSIIEILFGPDWSASGAILSILIFGAIFVPLTSLNLTLLKSYGKTFFALSLKAFSLIFVLVLFKLIPMPSFEATLRALVWFLAFQYVVSIIGLALLPNFTMANYLTRTFCCAGILVASLIVYELSAKFVLEIQILNLFAHGALLFFISSAFLLLFFRIADNAK
ncbi:oligosaccharide flippase family protein [Alphaproteobacteria bacterium]|nr:oligosaccharide flippase family protein [Alphaproteobacteria bacterium]MDA9581449.1 oligosaccharide flippase family protein [bacterium]MDA8624014.1 oligosaccharide flippase family protein [Alphaproteobacteria bacterium]MDA8625803.1 oligosaccharide flippase family protein [Alphaproteobacteria bacterium]MDA8642657.1 oligosaccharide flippase family protein [Alphaproteobacteria bacterium]